MSKPELTQELVRSLFDYDAETERLIRAANAWENGHTQIGPDMVSPKMLRDAAAEIQRLTSIVRDFHSDINELTDMKNAEIERLKAACANEFESVQELDFKLGVANALLRRVLPVLATSSAVEYDDVLEVQLEEDIKQHLGEA